MPLETPLQNPLDAGYEMFRVATRILACLALAAESAVAQGGTGGRNKDEDRGKIVRSLRDVIEGTVTRFQQLPSLLASWGLRATIVYYVSHASKTLEKGPGLRVADDTLSKALKDMDIDACKTLNYRHEDINATGFSYLVASTALAAILPDGDGHDGRAILVKVLGDAHTHPHLSARILHEIVKAAANPAIERLRPLVIDSSIVAARLAEASYTPLSPMLRGDAGPEVLHEVSCELLNLLGVHVG